MCMKTDLENIWNDIEFRQKYLIPNDYRGKVEKMIFNKCLTFDGWFKVKEVQKLINFKNRVIQSNLLRLIKKGKIHKEGVTTNAKYRVVK